MNAHQFFGFGSLVNLGTHEFGGVCASLRGWRRIWVKTTLRDVAFLSVERSPGARLDGILSAVPGGDWDALDKREYAYARVDATADIPGAMDAAVYQVDRQFEDHHTQGHILLSYLDVVVQGYLAQFGEDGVRDFFATTDGWDRAILDDRASPVYPRHQQLARKERALVDTQIPASAAVVQHLV